MHQLGRLSNRRTVLQTQGTVRSEDDPLGRTLFSIVPMGEPIFRHYQVIAFHAGFFELLGVLDG